MNNQEPKPLRYDASGESGLMQIGKALLPGLVFGIAMLILCWWLRLTLFQDRLPDLH